MVAFPYSWYEGHSGYFNNSTTSYSSDDSMERTSLGLLVLTYSYLCVIALPVVGQSHDSNNTARLLRRLRLRTSFGYFLVRLLGLSRGQPVRLR